MALIRTKLDLANPPDLTVEERDELKRLDEMRDADIDYSDIPELDSSFWNAADKDTSEPRSPLQGRPGSHRFEVYKGADGEYRVRFMYNQEVIFSTAGYGSKSDARRAVEIIKRHMSEASAIGSK